MDGNGKPFCACSQTFDITEARINHCGANVWLTRRDWWRAKLGLSIYVDTRCIVYCLYPHQARLSKGGAGIHEVGRTAVQRYRQRRKAESDVWVGWSQRPLRDRTEKSGRI